MKPEDLAHLQVPEALTLSPDGRWVVFSLRTIDLDRNEYVSRLWRVPTDGGAAPVLFTRGSNDTNPKYSPDGRWLAFRRSVSGSPPQLYLSPADGGEPWVVTDVIHHPLGVDIPVWSPDSVRISYCARVPETGRYGTIASIGATHERPRRITTLAYRLDSFGYTTDRPSQIFVIDPLTTSPTPTALTDGEFDNSNVAWSLDGSMLAFASARHPDRGRTMNKDIYLLTLDDGALRRLTDGSMAYDRPVFSHDGTTLFFTGMGLGEHGVDWFAQHTGAFAVPVDGSTAPRLLSDLERHTLDGHFGPSERGVLFANPDRGAIELLEFTPDGAEARVVIGGAQQVGAVDVVGARMTGLIADPTSPGEVVYVDDTGTRTLTCFGADLRVGMAIFGMEEITTADPDGYPVHGWLVRPAGPGPHPVLLMIHGGPFAQYGWAFSDEAQVYAEAGYAVVMGNPRGSSGYGHAHGRHVRGDVGARSAPDLLALLDHALRDSSLDPDRVGVLGGSHGGYMVNWLLAHSNRFRAGIAERSVCAVDSYLATSDLGWSFPSLYGDDPSRYADQSPLTYSDRVDTPLLIIHSEGDLRCPLEQAQRFYHALAVRGADVEMLVFPGGGHGFSRSGLPQHRVARFEAILDWFACHVR